MQYIDGGGGVRTAHAPSPRRGRAKASGCRGYATGACEAPSSSSHIILIANIDPTAGAVVYNVMCAVVSCTSLHLKPRGEEKRSCTGKHKRNTQQGKASLS